MSGPVIYHGTPLTPRAALNAVLPGRAACVSFFRPDDLEAVLAVCPQVMFRPRGVFLLDAGDACRSGVGRIRSSGMVAGLLSMARTDAVPSGSVGDHARQPRCTFPAQRWPSQRLALRSGQGRACLAHGWADREAGSHVRAVRSRLSRMDRAPEARARRFAMPTAGRWTRLPALWAIHGTRCTCCAGSRSRSTIRSPRPTAPALLRMGIAMTGSISNATFSITSSGQMASGTGGGGTNTPTVSKVLTPDEFSSECRRLVMTKSGHAAHRALDPSAL